MISLKHLDPLIGIDVHIVQPPWPGPPVPVPHPYTGMLLDPMDYIPKIGATVYVNGLPRAVAGTSGLAIPPHIPMGGMFVKPPTNESEMFMGSLTVAADGSPMSYSPIPVLSCQDIGMPPIPRLKKRKTAKSMMLPTTQAIPIPAGPLVMVGGPPNLLAAIASALQKKAMSGLFKGIAKKAKKSPRLRLLRAKAKNALKRASDLAHAKAEAGLNKLGVVGDLLRNAVHAAICTVTGHPVDVATGKVFTQQVDFELPGPIPLTWERIWYSTSGYRGPLGHGWHHAHDGALLVVGDEAIAVRTADGRAQAFLPLAVGEEQFDRKEKTTLARDGKGYTLRGSDGLVHRFGEVMKGEAHRLVAIEDVAGNAIRFTYDAGGRLTTIVDSCGRELTVSHDSQGRIARIAGPHPTDPEQRQVLVGYSYDGDGNLVESRDAAGQPMRYAYRKHLLVRETNRNGLSFHFEYDGDDEKARCLHTWGDGGIYDHKLTYEPGRTVVEDSLGHKTTYFHTRGTVFRTIDALGAVSETARNSWNELVREVDPLGQATVYQHDERGNVIKVIRPDGATITLAYDERDRLTTGVDPIGGQWNWRYDAQGRLSERDEPLGRTWRYQHGGRHLAAVIDPTGAATQFAYDPAGQLIAVRSPDGTVSRWAYDRRGHVVLAVDPKGNEQRRSHDALGRVTRVQEPDGNVRELAYDGEGNVVRARDQQHDVTFRYGGMGRLLARSEAGTTVAFEYDKEERLIAVHNEAGVVYRFTLGPTGEVGEEIGFDGATRRYHRDKAGRVMRVERPGGLESQYKYDSAGRATSIEHSDGSTERYAYRADGGLLHAVNDTAAIAFERDALGRVVKETTGEDWIASVYDQLGLRTRVRSSKGLEQVIERSVMGDVLAVRAAVGGAEGVIGRSGAPVPPGSPAGQGTTTAPLSRSMREGQTDGHPPTGDSLFEARFTRDQLGLELERTLPGGVRARWDRDKLGRPVSHELWSGDKILFGKQYSWEPNDRLRAIVDSLKGPVKYTHDALGNLAAAVYEDGRIDLRLPDAVGNLFRTEERSDRSYGPAGQLLEARGPDGVTRYAYDPEGNLARKTEPGGREWRYEWNAAGMLERVIRADGTKVEFGYDPLGRRVWKRHRGRTTRWIWDGNVPLHEWVEIDPTAVAAADAQVPDATGAQSSLVARQLALLATQPSQGPPLAAGTKAHPITWLFEPESFSPLARLHGTDRHAILTDHLGTPTTMVDAAGHVAWSADIDAYGDLRNITGDRHACPFRWPGQYEDAETGLYYNRFRYYDPEGGEYVTRDPIGLLGGLKTYGYVFDPLTRIDPWGLAENVVEVGSVREGMSKGADFAKVPRESKGGQNIPLSSLGQDSRGPNFQAMQRQGGTSLGRRHDESGAEFFLHPDGHPHQLGIDEHGNPFPAHHASPHIHAQNAKGEKVVFVVKPGTHGKAC